MQSIYWIWQVVMQNSGIFLEVRNVSADQMMLMPCAQEYIHLLQPYHLATTLLPFRLLIFLLGY